ncbi:uncharacterized protein PAE49_001055 isoform 2-T2 [Odontesthes bonariensis]
MENLKRKSGSGMKCAVVGCTSSRKHLNEWLDRECFDHKPATKRQCPCPPFFTFFRKPDTDSESRAWLKALDLKKPPRNVFVCSHHFADKRPTEDHPFPELWLGYNRFTRPKRRQLTERTAASPQIKKRRLQSEDVQQLFVIKEEVPWSSSVDQQDPEPVHIKEEEEELWSRREGEQLHGQEESDISRFSVTAVTVKSEDEEEQQPQSSQLLQIKTEDNRETEPPTSSSAELMKTEADWGKEPYPNSGLLPDTDEQEFCETEVSIGDDDSDWPDSESEASDDDDKHWQDPLSDSAPECEDGDPDWKKTRTAECREHDDDLISNSAEKSFSCSECGKQFVDERSLTSHMRVHKRERPFACDVCGKRVRERRTLLSHMRVHTGEKPFGCDFCAKRFNQVSNLKAHIRVHTMEKTHTCDDCGKKFKTKRHLTTHMSVHTGEKPFGCDVCGKTFRMKTNLKSHMRVHTGEKPFGCDVCGKKFSTKTNLNSHTRVHMEKNHLAVMIVKDYLAKNTDLKKHLQPEIR